MDNFNALSKSAILTKLALDGYFIDLLTLNSFIEKWHIEAIYENEFGIEFFDNNSYVAILDNLKNKYNETKQNLETSVKESYIEPANEPQENTSAQEAEEAKQLAQTMEEEFSGNSADNFETAAQDEQTSPAEEHFEEPKDDFKPLEEYNEPVHKPVNNYYEPMEKTYEAQNQETQASSVIQDNIQENIQISEFESEDDFSDSIMPAVMGGLKPGPVTPGSTIHVDHEYTPKASKAKVVQEETYEQYEEAYESKGAEPVHKGNEGAYDSELMDILEGDFTKEEIEKANKLMNGGSKETKKEEPQKAAQEEEGELDLMQLAQSFAKNLTKGAEEKAEPADLDTIFEESYTEGFENLQEFADASNNEHVQNSYYDLPDVNDIQPKYEKAKEIQEAGAPKAEPVQPQGQQNDNLSAKDIREIIRDEISRQVPKNVPATQNGDIKEIVTEIVKQTTEKMPQNAFKLDISNRTLDMVAKAIAKKIAVQLNDYYKLNITKQNQKLELFREKTIELKERNQALADENKKLKAQLVETNRNLNCYKPTLFGLFKFEKNKKTKKK